MGQTTAPRPAPFAALDKTQRTFLESVLAKRFFFQPSFLLYGGPARAQQQRVAGFYDYGPPGCALLANILSLWRQHFILEEDMYEVDCSIMTPHDVLKTSGHVDKFADWMVRDVTTGEIFRADHLVEAVIESRLDADHVARGASPASAVGGADEAGTKKKQTEAKKKSAKNAAEVTVLPDDVRREYENILAQIDNFSGKDLGAIIGKHSIKNPDTGNSLSEPIEFNLMFESSIGPTGYLKG
ncbi:MAG: hypothetical protein BJ554DRAFT_2153 [Olpidium bornovanus]|uniref:Uncharacterized protein n=1 Tax=Olpidium bornovanus TaxID=278681 RepID=A0A8H7ZR87_9FUNG|nr:MAG: hypothetical protein BJ554DRAFT_2153 [Olpidium bornovanus]